MPRYLSPKSDLVFKKIFGEHPDLLMSFLNALLPLPSDCIIEDLSYLPTEHVPEIPGFKYTIVDVRCRDNKGRYFIVEMQMSWSKYFMQRMIFNTAATYVKQLEKAADYITLCPVYGVAIVADDYTEGTDWFHHYQLINSKNSHQKFDDIQLVFLELPKFKPATLTEKKLSVLWMRYMTEIDESTHIVDPVLLENSTIKKALDFAEIAAYSPAELRSYDANWDAIRTGSTIMYDKYHSGLEKGREERNVEIARNLLSKGIDVEVISSSTGLSPEMIKTIQDEIK